MARAGLGAGWTCLFANDVDEKKARAYRANWGGEVLSVRDIRALSAADLPGRADLAWGSFPCQDLSLAGAGVGLNGARSGTFHAFWRLVAGLAAEGRAPSLVVLENVCGALTSRRGADFAAICRTFAEHGYGLGPLVMDAADFTPQSRPRLFLVGVREGVRIDPELVSESPTMAAHTPALSRAIAAAGLKAIWWTLPAPPKHNLGLANVIEDDPKAMRWHTSAQTRHILGLMSDLNREKVRAVQARGGRAVGAVYRRTRTDAAGRRVQRAEVRFDGVAGCLRTPAGGSSRQTLLIVDGGAVRSRLMSARETARLMGLADDYLLPPSATEAYHLTGDGVVVDVVRHLARHLLEPLLAR